MTITHKNKNTDVLSSKLVELEDKEINKELEFELNFMKYRLNNTLSSTKIKDINPNKRYELLKFKFFTDNSEFLPIYSDLITYKEIKIISKLKLSEYTKYSNNLNKIKYEKYKKINKLYMHK